MNLKQLQNRLKEFTQRKGFDNLKEFSSQLENVEFKAFSKFVRFSEERYCKNLLFRSEDFEIILICWKPFQKTPNHFHPDNGCLMKVFKGKLTETKLLNRKKVTNIYNSGDIGFVKSSEAHTIRNAKDHSISLHIYSPSGFYDTQKFLNHQTYSTLTIQESKAVLIK